MITTLTNQGSVCGCFSAVQEVARTSLIHKVETITNKESRGSQVGTLVLKFVKLSTVVLGSHVGGQKASPHLSSSVPCIHSLGG